jgi:hypothetical protein
MTAQLLLPKLGLKLGKIPQVFTHNLLFNTGNLLQALWLSLQVELKHLLPQIQAPCLLLWSDKDLTTPLEAAQEMAAAIPDASLTTVEEGFHDGGSGIPKIYSATAGFYASVERTATSATQARG